MFLPKELIQLIYAELDNKEDIENLKVSCKATYAAYQDESWWQRRTQEAASQKHVDADAIKKRKGKKTYQEYYHYALNSDLRFLSEPRAPKIRKISDASLTEESVRLAKRRIEY